MDTYTAIVIGSGSGGLVVAVGLAGLGKRVMLVERDQMGGDCTNTGCIPSKSLLHLSSGVAADQQADSTSILATVRKQRDALRHHEEEEFGTMAGIDLRYGNAEIVAAGRVRVTPVDGPAWEAEADHIVICTGSHARRLPLPGLPEGKLLTNHELFEMTTAPASLAIVGGGAIGLEMATAFNRLGTAVTIVEAADRLIPTTLPAVHHTIAPILTQQGIAIHTGVFAESWDPATRELVMTGGGRVPAERVLQAIGRIPNSADIGLERVGVETNKAGRIVIDDRGRTSVKGIWAAGDVTDRGGTTHDAEAWARRIFASIFVSVVPLGDVPVRTGAVFTDPEIATIGVQEDEPAEHIIRITKPMAAEDRSFTDEVDTGFVTVDIDRFSGRTLGATIVGPRAGELIGMFGLAMRNDLTLHDWYGSVFPYPSYTRVLQSVVDEWVRFRLTDLRDNPGQFAIGKAKSVVSGAHESIRNLL